MPAKRAPSLETARLIMSAHVLCAELAGVIAESRRLVERSRRTVFAAYPHLRPIRGGSDAALIATVLSAAPLCPACMAKKTGVPSDRLAAVLGEIGTSVKLETGPGRCHACLEDHVTSYRLATTDGAAATTDGVRAPAPPGRDGLWRFLEEHRGRMFCTACLVAALGATRRIDRLVLAAEGRGALRRHEHCSVCGKDRLVCGLTPNGDGRTPSG